MRLLGSKILKGIYEGPVKEADRAYVEDNKIPKTFDARTQWKNCKTMGQVRNQGNCGSCWVMTNKHNDSKLTTRILLIDMT